MNNFIGNWKLEINDNNFNKFLKFYKYSYCIRMAILSSSIKINIKYNNNKSFYKSVISNLYSVDEIYCFDNKWYETHDNLKKKHKLIDNMIYSNIILTTNENIKWKEIVYIKDNKLYVNRKWKENNIEYSSIQIFIKDES